MRVCEAPHGGPRAARAVTGWAQRGTAELETPNNSQNSFASISSTSAESNIARQTERKNIRGARAETCSCRSEVPGGAELEPKTLNLGSLQSRKGGGVPTEVPQGARSGNRCEAWRGSRLGSGDRAEAALATFLTPSSRHPQHHPPHPNSPSRRPAHSDGVRRHPPPRTGGAISRVLRPDPAVLPGPGPPRHLHSAASGRHQPVRQ